MSQCQSRPSPPRYSWPAHRPPIGMPIHFRSGPVYCAGSPRSYSDLTHSALSRLSAGTSFSKSLASNGPAMADQDEKPQGHGTGTGQPQQIAPIDTATTRTLARAVRRFSHVVCHSVSPLLRGGPTIAPFIGLTGLIGPIGPIGPMTFTGLFTANACPSMWPTQSCGPYHPGPSARPCPARVNENVLPHLPQPPFDLAMSTGYNVDIAAHT